MLVVKKSDLEQVSPRMPSFSFVSIIPPILHILLHQDAAASPHIEMNRTEVPSNDRKARLDYTCCYYSLRGYFLKYTTKRNYYNSGETRVLTKTRASAESCSSVKSA